MTALIAVLIFPVLTLLLVALTKAENMLGSLAVEPSVAPSADPAPAPLRVVQELDALPVPRPQLRLVEAPENLAA